MSPLLRQMLSKLESVEEAYAAGNIAGDEYTQMLEEIRADIDSDDEFGTSLGTMVAQELLKTEVDTKLNKMKFAKDGPPKGGDVKREE